MARNTPTALDHLLRRELDALQANSQLRQLRPVAASAKYVEVDGQRLLNLASNDYLGLTQHPKLIDAGCAAARQYGAGAGASRLVSGTLEIHSRAERSLAKLKHAEAALLLATGYTANLAVLGTLAARGDLICQDKLNHASLIDAARASGAEVRTYPHLDLGKVERLLSRHAEQHGIGITTEEDDFWEQIPADAREAAGMAEAGDASDSSQDASSTKLPERRQANGGARGAGSVKRFIVTDSVFSMDGDCADLPALCDLADRYDAVLVIDDAHGTGVLGQQGGGLAEHQGVAERVYRAGMGGVVISTASKALGGSGGIVSGSQTVIDYLVTRARPFIYSTAVPPAQAATVEAAAELIIIEPERRHKLSEMCERFAAGLRDRGWPIAERSPMTPIFPLIVGTSEAALALASRMQAAGVLGVAIRPPTVPPGTARVRVSLRADLERGEVGQALDAIGRSV